MEEKLVTFETAKLIKDKNLKVLNKAISYITCFYHSRTKTLLRHGRTGRVKSENLYHAPTQVFLQAWLREEHNLYLESKQFPYSDTEWRIVNSYGHVLSKPEIHMFYNGFPIKNHMYENVGLEYELQKALELIKIDEIK